MNTTTPSAQSIEIIKDLVHLALTTPADKAHIFIDLAPHTQQVDIHCYPGGWKDKKEDRHPDCWADKVYYAHPDADGQLLALRSRLQSSLGMDPTAIDQHHHVLMGAIRARADWQYTTGETLATPDDGWFPGRPELQAEVLTGIQTAGYTVRLTPPADTASSV